MQLGAGNVEVEVDVLAPCLFRYVRNLGQLGADYFLWACPEINSTAVFHDTIEVVPDRDFDVDGLAAAEETVKPEEWHAFMAAAGTVTAAEDMRHWEDGATLPSSDGKPENTLTRAELDVAFDRIKRDKATHEFGVGIEAYIASPEAKEYLYVLVQDL